MPQRNPSAIVAGEMRHRIALIAPAFSQDSAGGVDPFSSEGDVFATVWAKVESLTGRLREEYAGQQKVGELYYRVTMRWIDGVHSRFLVNWQGRAFQILQVQDPDGLRKRLDLICIERDESMRTPGISPT